MPIREIKRSVLHAEAEDMCKHHSFELSSQKATIILHVEDAVAATIFMSLFEM